MMDMSHYFLTAKLKENLLIINVKCELFKEKVYWHVKALKIKVKTRLK